MSPAWTTIAALALLALPARGEAPPAARPNVVLIVLDACRADRMGFLGNPRGLTPFLDSLAARAYVFRRAYSAAPHTTASIASLFTSRMPSRHGVVWFTTPLPDTETTLAEVLAAHGIASGAFTGNLLFHGAAQGFDTLSIVTEPDGPGGHVARVNASALTWLGRLPQRTPPPASTFVYLHYMDTHAPYTPERQVVARLHGRLLDPAPVNARLWTWTAAPPPPADLGDLRAIYDASVATADGALRNFFTTNGPTDLFAHAIVVVTADHGEGLGEHGEVGHGRWLHDTTTHVPLLILLPDRAGRVDVDEPVSLLDVAPTLLDLLDLPIPPSWEGVSLRPAMARADHPWRPATWWWRLWQGRAGGRLVLSENAGTFADAGLPDPVHRAAVVRGDAKAIVHLDGTRAYFDLAADPGETAPDALAPATRTRLDDALRRLLAQRAAALAPAAPDAATPARLRALGYVGD